MQFWDQHTAAMGAESFHTINYFYLNQIHTYFYKFLTHKVGRRPIICHTALCNICTPVHISYYFILLLMYYIVQIYVIYLVIRGNKSKMATKMAAVGYQNITFTRLT